METKENSQELNTNTGKTHRVRNILLIAAPLIVALVVLIVVVFSGGKKPKEKTAGNQTQPTGTPEEEGVVRYDFTVTMPDYTKQTETVRVPEKRLTLRVSELSGWTAFWDSTAVTDAELTFSNLPDWKLVFKKASLYDFDYSVDIKLVCGEEECFGTGCATGMLYFTDWNGDGVQELSIVSDPISYVYDLQSRKGYRLDSTSENESFTLLRESEKDVVIYTKQKGEEFRYERGTFVVENDALIFREIPNPTDIGSAVYCPESSKVFRWFDYLDGDEERRQEIRLAEDDEFGISYVADGEYGYWYSTEAGYFRRTESTIYPFWSLGYKRYTRALNAYIADLDGDGQREVCLTCLISGSEGENGETGLWLVRENKRLQEIGYAFRFAEENGRLVVKRKKAGGDGAEETFSVCLDTDGRLELYPLN